MFWRTRHIWNLRDWLIPLLSVSVGPLIVLVLLASWTGGAWYRLFDDAGFQLIAVTFVTGALGMAFAVFVITLALNSWIWLMRCPLRRYLAQLLVGVGLLGGAGYMYSDLLWKGLGDHLLLLEYGSGIQLWALIYLLALNLAFVFVRLTISFMATGASPRDGYLRYLLVLDEQGRDEKLLVPEDVLYIHSAEGAQRVQTGDPARPPLEYGVSLDRTEALLDPLEYHRVNRNYIVHWSAIKSLRPEPDGRRLLVELDPPPSESSDSGHDGAFLYVSKEKSKEVHAWYASCLARAG